MTLIIMSEFRKGGLGGHSDRLWARRAGLIGMIGTPPLAQATVEDSGARSLASGFGRPPGPRRRGVGAGPAPATMVAVGRVVGGISVAGHFALTGPRRTFCSSIRRPRS